MNAPLARFLTRFSDVEPVAIVDFDPAPAEPTVTLTEDAFNDRLAAVRDEAMADAAAATEAQVLALTATHEAALTEILIEARARWVADEGATHAALLSQAFADLRDDLSRRIATALKPLVAAALAERAQTAVGEALDHIVADPDHPVVTMRGPNDLLEGIRAARAETEGLERVSYVTADSVEITIDAAGTHIETRLAVALAAIQGL